MRYSAGNKHGIAKMPGIPRVLKQVAKAPLQLRSVNPRSAFRTPHTQPQPGEEAIVILRVQVLSCKDLVARDKGGTTNP
jgi:phosphatidylserine decarboxylase